MRLRQVVAVGALCGTIALAGWGAAHLGGFGSFGIENAATTVTDREATRIATSSSAAIVVPDPPEPAVVPVTDSVSEATLRTLPVPDSDPPPGMQLASVSTSDPIKEDPKAAVRTVDAVDECSEVETCIDDYLWSLYERTPKIDTYKVTEQIKVKVKKKGKTRTVTRTTTKVVVGDFTWKDPNAAEKAGMALKDYVIGGVDRGFKLKLYHALRAMDAAGLMPGITSAFRDDYRQSIASGNKAASDSSYHGGSRRGGYGHGLAADIVSVKGETRVERLASSDELWKWIDAHETELGIGRPYLDRDPPHVGPIDGKEFADKRHRANGQTAGLPTNSPLQTKVETKKRQLAARKDDSGRKR
jgi:hypothetical protein